MLMEIFMMENGLMMQLVVKEHMYILMEPDMKVNGLMIINTDMVLKYGLMEQIIEVNISMGKRMEKDI